MPVIKVGFHKAHEQTGDRVTSVSFALQSTAVNVRIYKGAEQLRAYFPPIALQLHLLVFGLCYNTEKHLVNSPHCETQGKKSTKTVYRALAL